jgi:hypothetical protein
MAGVSGVDRRISVPSGGIADALESALAILCMDLEHSLDVIAE